MPIRSARVLAQVLRAELRRCRALVTAGPQDDRGRGQAEAFRHVETVLEVKLGPVRRKRRRA